MQLPAYLRPKLCSPLMPTSLVFRMFFTFPCLTSMHLNLPLEPCLYAYTLRALFTYAIYTRYYYPHGDPEQLEGGQGMGGGGKTANPASLASGALEKTPTFGSAVYLRCRQRPTIQSATEPNAVTSTSPASQSSTETTGETRASKTVTHCIQPRPTGNPTTPAETLEPSGP